MNCDNHPVPASHAPGLATRPAQPDAALQDPALQDQDLPLEFHARRPLPSGSTLTLGVCNGEIHVLPGADSGVMTIDVHVSAPLGGERTPKSYLQRLTTDAAGADVEWKLPESAHPVIEVHVPSNTHLNLELGTVTLDVKGIHGNKYLNAGKGTAKLYVPSGATEYSLITVEVAMGSFADLRPGGVEIHKVPLHKEFKDAGTFTADLKMAMGNVEFVPE